MLAVFFCLFGIFVILALSEILGQKKILTGELQRKFVHIASGSFIASWPWLINWQAIAWIGTAMLLFVLLNHRARIVDFHSHRPSHGYGDVFFALAVVAGALITDQKAFFAMAMLTMAWGDGIAGLAGQMYGKHWRYKVFGYTKTIIGTMAIWIVSIYILAAGITLMANSVISYKHYALLVLFLPPLVAAVENLAVNGFDNLVMPILVIGALSLAG
jgi:phytol kinase